MRGALQNLGQTCAINSLVQIIAHSARLREAIMDGSSQAYCKADGKIMRELADVIDKIYAQRQHTSPGGLVGAMFRLFPHDLVPGEQHDICELWMLLSSRLADEMGAGHTVNVTPICTASAHIHAKVLKLIESMYSKSWSPWLERILGVELSIVQCNACKDQPWSPEVFTILPLNMSGNAGDGCDGEVTIEQLLLQHFEIEELTDWSCDKCKCKGGKKQNKLYSLPPVLMVSIKRFRMSRTSGRFSKVHTPVTISDQLKFEIGGSMKIYMLRGVGNHYGSYNFGHYTACVYDRDRDRDINDEGAWFCYDDANVAVIPDCNFLRNNRDAYILCYELF